MSKCHIVGNHMSLLTLLQCICPTFLVKGQDYGNGFSNKTTRTGKTKITLSLIYNTQNIIITSNETQVAFTKQE